MDVDNDVGADGRLVSFGTRLPEQLAREVRAAAALEGRSVQDWTAEALREKLDRGSS